MLQSFPVSSKVYLPMIRGSSIHVTDTHCTMPQTPLDELKSLSHSDTQKFANYLGSRLRTIAKVYYTRKFATPEEKMQVYNNWGQELVSDHDPLNIYPLPGCPHNHPYRLCQSACSGYCNVLGNLWQSPSTFKPVSNRMIKGCLSSCRRTGGRRTA